MIICLLLTTLFLCILSVSDLRTNTIPAWAAPAFTLSVLILHAFLRDLSVSEIFAGLIPGALLLAVSFLFGGALGCGDALTAAACGAALGPERTIASLTAAFIFCALISILLLARKRIRRSDTLPFLPFLAASHIIMLIAEVIR